MVDGTQTSGLEALKSILPLCFLQQSGVFCKQAKGFLTGVKWFRCPHLRNFQTRLANPLKDFNLVLEDVAGLAVKKLSAGTLGQRLWHSGRAHT